MMLLAPKTLWAMVNLSGSVGGKYGANTHFSTHLRRRILQAAQGLTIIGGGGDGGWGAAEGGEYWEAGEGKGVGDCKGGEEDEDGVVEFDSMVWMGTWIGIGRWGGELVVFILCSIVLCEKQRKTERLILLIQWILFLLLCNMVWKLKDVFGYIYRPKGKHVGSELVTSSQRIMEAMMTMYFDKAV